MHARGRKSRSMCVASFLFVHAGAARPGQLRRCRERPQQYALVVTWRSKRRLKPPRGRFGSMEPFHAPFQARFQRKSSRCRFPRPSALTKAGLDRPLFQLSFRQKRQRASIAVVGIKRPLCPACRFIQVFLRGQRRMIGYSMFACSRLLNCLRVRSFDTHSCHGCNLQGANYVYLNVGAAKYELTVRS